MTARVTTRWMAFYAADDEPVLSSFKLASDRWLPMGHIALLQRKAIVELYGNDPHYRFAKVEIREKQRRAKARKRRAKKGGR